MASSTADAATGHQLRRPYASTTSPAASATIAVREYVKSRPTSRKPVSAESQRDRCQVAATSKRDDEHVRGRERAQEGGHEPSQRPLVAGVVDEVLRQAGETRARSRGPAARGTSPARRSCARCRAGSRRCRRAPRRRQPRPRREHGDPDPPQLVAIEVQAASEEVRGDGRQVVARREDDPARGGVSAEYVLGDQPVEHDEARIGEGEIVHRGRLERQAALPPDEQAERDRQQHLLPRRDDVQRGAPDTEIPEAGHGQVVQRQQDDERVEGVPGKPLSQRSPPASCRG